jgi:hypothetical protein
MSEPDTGQKLELEAMRHVYDAAVIAATNEMHDNDSKLDADIRLMHHLWLRGFRLRALASEQGAEPNQTDVDVVAQYLSDNTYFDGRGPSHEHWQMMARGIIRVLNKHREGG